MNTEIPNPVDYETYIDRFLAFLDDTKSLFTRTPDSAIVVFEETKANENES